VALERAGDDERLQEAMGRGRRDAERARDAAILDLAPAVDETPEPLGRIRHEGIL
jgi:hypothetical protein